MALNIQNEATDELQEQHEINVTPFIDVILVLLIIFMVAAPLATVSVPVNLPTATAPTQATVKDPLYLTVQLDLSLTLGEKQSITRELLITALQELNIDNQQQIFLRADNDVPYGEFMKIMSSLSKAGYQKVSLVALEGTTNS